MKAYEYTTRDYDRMMDDTVDQVGRYADQLGCYADQREYYPRVKPDGTHQWNDVHTCAVCGFVFGSEDMIWNDAEEWGICRWCNSMIERASAE